MFFKSKSEESKKNTDPFLSNLILNRDQFIIDEDGMIGTNFDHPEVKEEMKRVIGIFSKVEMG